MKSGKRAVVEAQHARQEQVRELARRADVLAREPGQELAALETALRAWHDAGRESIQGEPEFFSTLLFALQMELKRHPVRLTGERQVWFEPGSDRLLTANAAGSQVTIETAGGKTLLTRRGSSFAVDPQSGRVAILDGSKLYWGPIAALVETSLPMTDPRASRPDSATGRSRIVLNSGGISALIDRPEGALFVDASGAAHQLGSGWSGSPVALSNDGTKVAVAANSFRPDIKDEVAFFAPGAGEPARFAAPAGDVSELIFDEPGALLFGTDGAQLVAWDLKLRRVIRDWTLHHPEGAQICLTQEGARDLPRSLSKYLIATRQLAIPKPQLERPLPGEGCEFGYLSIGGRGSSSRAFSPDARRLAVGYDSGRIRIFNVRSGALEAELAGHSAPVQFLAWLPGDQLASADGAVTRLWAIGKTGDPRLVDELPKVGEIVGFVLASRAGWLGIVGHGEQEERGWFFNSRKSVDWRVTVSTQTGLLGRRRAVQGGRIERLLAVPDGILVLKPDRVEFLNEMLEPVVSALLPVTRGTPIRWEARADGTALAVAPGAAWLWRARKLTRIDAVIDSIHLAQSSDEVAIGSRSGRISIRSFEGKELVSVGSAGDHWREGWSLAYGTFLLVSDGKRTRAFDRIHSSWVEPAGELARPPAWLLESGSRSATVVHDLPVDAPVERTRERLTRKDLERLPEALFAAIFAGILGEKRPFQATKLSDTVALVEIDDSDRRKLSGLEGAELIASLVGGKRRVRWTQDGTVVVSEKGKESAALAVRIGRATIGLEQEPWPDLGAGGLTLTADQTHAVAWRAGGEIALVPLDADGIVAWACEEGHANGLTDSGCPR
jgi:hypothetical protein